MPSGSTPSVETGRLIREIRRAVWLLAGEMALITLGLVAWSHFGW